MHKLAPLIEATEAHGLWRHNPVQARFVDCRFALQDVHYGSRAFAQGHLPEAVYAHLDRDLSGSVIPGHTGRHPLPAVSVFEITLRRWGIHHDTHIVAYDDASGVFASRLWWMLHWVGHDRVQVLNGGLAAWNRAGLPLTQDMTMPRPSAFRAQANAALVAEAADILQGSALVVDARERERYTGEREPIDTRAGHIPGALNHPHQHNLTAHGAFLPPQVLANVLHEVWGTHAMEDTVVYCGSGVSACHNLLAAAYAGRGMPKLYPGSWSEWITDPAHPVVQGPAP